MGRGRAVPCIRLWEAVYFGVTDLPIGQQPGSKATGARNRDSSDLKYVVDCVLGGLHLDSCWLPSEVWGRPLVDNWRAISHVSRIKDQTWTAQSTAVTSTRIGVASRLSSTRTRQPL